MRKIVLLLACFLVGFWFTGIHAQNQLRPYTLTFNHDGIGVDSFDMEVDGVRSVITPSCVGTGDTRLCTSSIQLTYGIQHTVKVYAVGIFGEGVSAPFVCVLPKNPGNAKVGK